MKGSRAVVVILAVLLVAVYFVGAVNSATTQSKTFAVYQDKYSVQNHFIPSGWMGDYGDIKFNDGYELDVADGKTAIELVYTAESAEGKGWAGIYWQNPANNWGSIQGGFDLSSFNKLTFWAKGANGNEIIDKVKVGGMAGMYPDSADVDLGPIQLTNTWEKYEINLSDQDLTYVSGGFAIVMNKVQNPNGAAIYLDGINFEYEEGLAKSVEDIQLPFYVYADGRSLDNHFTLSGWMGDFGDLQVDQNSSEKPYSGDSCVKINYSGKGTQGARWAGIYWQNPPNNWGEEKKGFDLSKSTALKFWAKGSKGGERIEEFKIGGIRGRFPDSGSARIGPVILSTEWQEYTIDLRGTDLSHIIGGFCFATNNRVNPQGATIYLDEIRYE